MIAEEWAPLIVSIIFDAADNIIVKDKKADSAIVIEFPVILRLLYICGLRIGETIRIRLSDVDFERGILYMLSQSAAAVPLTVQNQFVNLQQEHLKKKLHLSLFLPLPVQAVKLQVLPLYLIRQMI